MGTPVCNKEGPKPEAQTTFIFAFGLRVLQSVKDS